MILGLVVFFLYLYFFVGFDDIFLVIENVNLTRYLFYYSLAICTLLLVMFLWVISWKTLLNALSIKVSWKNAFLYYWVGYFIDLVVPCQGVCGEAARMYLVRRETEHDYGAIAACGITNRIVFYTVVTVGLSAGLGYLFNRGAVTDPIVLYILILAWIGSVIHVGVLLYLALSDQAVRKLASLIFRVLKFLRVRRYSSEGTVQHTFRSLSLFHQGSTFFRQNPKHLILPFAFQILAYVLNITVYGLVLSTLGFDFLFIEFFLVVYFLAGAIQDASAVFSVGALEIVLTSVFVFYGYGAAVSGVAVALLRSVVFWFPVVVGYIIIQVVGAKNILNTRGRGNVPVEPSGGEEETPTLNPLLKPP